MEYFSVQFQLILMYSLLSACSIKVLNFKLRYHRKLFSFGA